MVFQMNFVAAFLFKKLDFCNCSKSSPVVLRVYSRRSDSEVYEIVYVKPTLPSENLIFQKVY